MKTINYTGNSSKSGIYKIINTVNNKLYVGSASLLGNRLSGHSNSLKKNTHRNRYLQRAYNKYGSDVFVFEVIELCPKISLRYREQYYMDLYKVLDSSLGYNISPDCICPNRGLKRTAENKLKISIGRKGKCKGIIPKNLAGLQEQNKRSVDEYYEGIKINTYSSSVEAAEAHGINYKSVNNACRYLTPNMWRILPGYTFRYSDGGSARITNYKKKNDICSSKYVRGRKQVL